MEKENKQESEQQVDPRLSRGSELMDKDRLILVAEIGVNGVNNGDVPCYLDEVSKAIRKSFDMSVIVLVVPRADTSHIEFKQLNTEKMAAEELDAVIAKGKEVIETLIANGIVKE